MLEMRSCAYSTTKTMGRKSLEPVQLRAFVFLDTTRSVVTGVAWWGSIRGFILERAGTSDRKVQVGSRTGAVIRRWIPFPAPVHLKRSMRFSRTTLT